MVYFNLKKRDRQHNCSLSLHFLLTLYIHFSLCRDISMSVFCHALVFPSLVSGQWMIQEKNGTVGHNLITVSPTVTRFWEAFSYTSNLTGDLALFYVHNQRGNGHLLRWIYTERKQDEIQSQITYILIVHTRPIWSAWVSAASLFQMESNWWYTYTSVPSPIHKNMDECLSYKLFL